MFKDYPDILTVPQIAEILGISKNTAYQMVKRGEIGSKHIGRKIKVPKVCLIDYVISARYTVSKSNP